MKVESVDEIKNIVADHFIEVRIVRSALWTAVRASVSAEVIWAVTGVDNHLMDVSLEALKNYEY